ncbi:pre-mRNA cleavage complex 2 Pcf11-like protein isoform X2 [Tasmannia lanceolata]|uniref:pre-mRNA cleavage complex 2 Pcf11-like protein isoform X2 n=1 Tax=Tasmannia lanceolata TaxID=3420 RepID=UPI004064AC57
MKSSGRSLARAREPGLKKPRLVQEAEPNLHNSNNSAIIDPDRPFPQRVPMGGGGGPLISRVRAEERDREVGREDSARGAYQQSHQELVTQYKTALAELTFNSKPIITNLTIIAGENLHSAKSIVAAVCANILEVPSEQKLPSLYLLDSIVKNIGRDYIKYFAAKLPEVFCKAYGQVDSSIHPGMRHLFGTWKGVFPPASLQIIEKELGFPPAINGSSSGVTTSRPDSQSQRPPHSIHVNPKYLEARQRLQQTTRSKGISSDNSGSTGSVSVDDGDKLDRTAISGSARPWTDLPVKNVQRPQREQLNEPILDRNPNAGYGDYERQSDIEIGKSWERIAEQGLEKPWYGAGSADSTVGQKNSFDIPNVYGNHRPHRSTQASSQLHPAQAIASRSSRGTSGNWKNSEEEEYMWEDMNSRLTDHGGTHNSRKDGLNPDDAKEPVSSQRGKWMPSETELLDARWNTLNTSRLEKPAGGEGGVPLQTEREVEDHLPAPRGLPDIGSRAIRETFADSLSGGLAAFGHRAPSVWPSQVSRPIDVLNLSSSLSREGPGLHMGRSVGSLSSSSGSVANAVSESSGMFGHQKQLPVRSASPSEPLSAHQHPHSPSSSSTHQHQQSRSQMQKPPSQPPIFREPQILGYPGTGNSDNAAAEVLGQSRTSSLLAAIMKSGLPLTNSAASSFPSLSYPDLSMPSNLNIQPPLPSGPPPVQGTTSRGNVSAIATQPSRAVLPPLPPGPPPPSSLVGSSAQMSSTASAVPNPLSNLLSSLVAKGLISGPATELPALSAPIVSTKLHNQSTGLTISTPMPVLSSSAASAMAPSSSVNELPFSESSRKGTSFSQATTGEIKDLIGIEFKPEIIREFHPSVISALFDDLPHQCSMCGNRFKLQEQLDRHVDWHASKKYAISCCNGISQKWFVDLSIWVGGNVGPPSEPVPTYVEAWVKTAEKCEPMVPADERQCVCVLCGETFEDFFSLERDEWMYKGAVYMTIPAGEAGEGGTDESSVQGPIVHANCISRSLFDDFEVAEYDKVDYTDG